MSEDYNKFKKENADCFIPEEHIIKGQYANTPEYLRRWCVLKYIVPKGAGIPMGYGKESLKKQSQDIWEYFNYLLEILLDNDTISKEMHETLMSGYEKKFMKYTAPKDAGIPLVGEK